VPDNCNGASIRGDSTPFRGLRYGVVRFTQRSSTGPMHSTILQLLHRACRLGNVTVAELLLSRGAWARVADDTGKTALHDLAWTSHTHLQASLRAAELLLDRDESLLRAVDARGCTAFDYLHPSVHAAWRAFLQEGCDRWWAASKAPGVTPQEWAERLWPLAGGCGLTLGSGCDGAPHIPAEASGPTFGDPEGRSSSSATGLAAALTLSDGSSAQTTLLPALSGEASSSDPAAVGTAWDAARCAPASVEVFSGPCAAPERELEARAHTRHIENCTCDKLAAGAEASAQAGSDGSCSTASGAGSFASEPQLARASILLARSEGSDTLRLGLEGAAFMCTCAARRGDATAEHLPAAPPGWVCPLKTPPPGRVCPLKALFSRVGCKRKRSPGCASHWVAGGEATSVVAASSSSMARGDSAAMLGAGPELGKRAS
jgi:hypothetical protein